MVELKSALLAPFEAPFDFFLLLLLLLFLFALLAAFIGALAASMRPPIRPPPLLPLPPVPREADFDPFFLDPLELDLAGDDDFWLPGNEDIAPPSRDGLCPLPPPPPNPRSGLASMKDETDKKKRITFVGDFIFFFIKIYIFCLYGRHLFYAETRVYDVESMSRYAQLANDV